MANLSQTDAQTYALTQESEGDCWLAAIAMCINIERQNPKLVSVSAMRQAVSAFTKAKSDWASPETWGVVARRLAERCAVNFTPKKLTEVAMDSSGVATAMVNDLNNCSALIVTVHNASGGYHDVVIVGHSGSAAALHTRFVMIDPATGTASEVTLNTLWNSGIGWISSVWRHRGG